METKPSFASHFKLDPTACALNNAGVAPMCRPAREALNATAELMCKGGTHALSEIFANYEHHRAQIAGFIGAQPKQLCLLETCAAAISQVALGLSFSSTDEIVTWDQEYPSNAYPWFEAARRSGARIIRVPSEANLAIRTERLLDAITPRTRAVAISWVQFQTGAITDLRDVRERCDRVGAWLCVDAIQGIGIVPFNMSDLKIDAVCGGSHKWLCGPLGLGFLALREDRLRELNPLYHGAMSYGTSEDPVDPDRALRPDAKRYEPGTPMILSTAATAAAIEALEKSGPGVVRAHALKLADRLAQGVRDRGGVVLSDMAHPDRNPIVTFTLPKPTKQIAANLKAAGVWFASRAGGIRISPHAFNTERDIDQVLIRLDELG